jgi:hypothetical protein
MLVSINATAICSKASEPPWLPEIILSFHHKFPNLILRVETQIMLPKREHVPQALGILRPM